MSEKKAKSFLKRQKTKKVPKVERRLFSQKQMNRYFWTGVIGFVGLSGLAVSASVVRSFKAEETKPQVVQKVDSSQDYRLEYFLDGYIYAYFTRSSDTTERQQEEEVLNSYYNFEPEVRQKSTDKIVSQLESQELLYVKDNVAMYRVSYLTGEGDQQKEISVNFGIPYGTSGGKYYVSGLPYFSSVEDYKATKVDKKTELKLVSSNDYKDKEKLDEFIKVFFDNYTTSQDNLSIIAKGVTSINGVAFKSLDYSYYKEVDGKIMAYIQASLDVAGMVHQENFTLTIVKKDKSYFIEKLEHAIPADYAK